MQNRYRLYLAAIVLAAFTLAIAVIGASGTSDAEDPANSCGNGLTWTYDNNTYTLKIELTDSTKDGKMADYTDESEQPWRGLRSLIWELNIDDRVTSIGDYAFYGCSGLTGTLTIPGSVKTIGDYAFQGCFRLTGTLTIPGTVEIIGDYAFYGCSGLTSLTFSEGSKLTTIGHHAFEGCSGLTGTLTIPGSVTSIGDHVFDGCSKLTGFAVDPANTSYASDSQGILYSKDMTTLLLCPVGKTGEITIPGSVKTIGHHAFDGCSKLTGFAMDPANTSYASDSQGILYSKDMTTLLLCPGGKSGGITIPGTVETIGDYAFYGCSGLTSLTFSEGCKLTTIGDYAFYGCFGLTGTLTIPGTVEIIGDYAFNDCRGLSSLTFSEGSNLTTIGGYAFNGCSGLTGTLTIPATVETIGYGSFGRCSILTGFAVDPANTSYASDSQGILYDKDMTTLLQCPGNKSGGITIPGTVEIIGDYAFYGCSSLTGTLTIPGTVETIGDYAFYGCSSLTGNLTIPDSVTYIGDYAFYNCYGFTGDLTIPGSVTYIGALSFYSCYGFTGDLTIPDSVTSIGDYAFYVCENLTGTLTIGEKVTYIGDYAFNRCKFKGTLTIPGSVTYIGKDPFWGSEFTGDLTIPDSVMYIGESAFAYCGFTGNLTIPDSVTSIEYGAFQGCGFTGNLTIPDSVTYIGTLSFYNCKGFTGNLTIPDSVTSIAYGAFQGCSNLKGTLTIGKKVTYIGDSAFDDCKFTGNLTIPDSVTSIGDFAFQNCYLPDINNLDGSRLTIGKNVTYIGNYAFQDSSGIKSELVIPDSVTYIGTHAFAGPTLLRIVFPESVETIANGAFAYNTFHDYDDKWVEVDATAENLRGKAWVGKADDNYVKLYRSFDITFDANGGSFQTGDGEKILYSDPDRKLSEDPGASSKTGHEFKGWFTASGEGFYPGKQFAADTTYLARYAEWALTVTFLSGEGAGNMGDQTIYYGSDDKKLKKCEYTREGYGFGGWTDKDGNPYEDGADMSEYMADNVKSSDAVLNLTAKWDIKFKVTVDTSDPGIASVEYMIGDGGTFVSYTAPFEVVHGSKLTLRAVVDDGYEFKEWQPSGETGDVLIIGSVTGDTDLAPKASKLAPGPTPPGPEPEPKPKPKPQVITITVTFESVGGGHTSEDSVKVPLNSKIMVYGDTLVIGSGNATVKAIPDAGHVFSGWMMDEALLLGGGLLSDTVITASFGETVLAGMYIWKEPDKVDYSEGEKFDPAGLVIALRYSDGSEVHVDYEGNESRFSFDPSLDTPLKPSDDRVTVKYGGMSAVQEITVSENGFPWWIVLIVAALALLILFIVLKRRKDEEEESVG